MKRTYMTKAVPAGVLAAMLVVGASCTSERVRPVNLTAPTRYDAGYAEYCGIYDYPVRLFDGRYEGEAFVDGGASRPTVQLVDDLFEAGDLDGDETEEMVVLLVESSGGSGSFIYLAVVARRAGEIVNIGTCLVGDRVQVRSLDIEGDSIVMNVVEHGPGDAACCPSQRARRVWGLEDGELVEKSSEVTGTLSIVDLYGKEWLLVRSRWIGKLLQDPHITIVFEDGRVSGSSGCNRYFADITESSPGYIAIGETGMTRMVCSEEIMLLERGYLEAIGGAVKYGFLAGRLALTCKVGDEMKIMLFKAVEQDASGE